MTDSERVIFSARDIDYLVLHLSEEQLTNELYKAKLECHTAEFWGQPKEQAFFTDYIDAITTALEIIRSKKPVPAVFKAKDKQHAADPQDIKQRVDIVDVIGHYLPLKKSGKYFTACCPFHEEKDPSFFVYQEKKFFKCYGCQKSGDIFSFIMEIEHTDFKGALQILERL